MPQYGEGYPRRDANHVHGWTRGRCRTCLTYCQACRKCGCEADADYGAAVRANHAAAQVVHDGKAFGGPRDGVRLKASARWDGVLEKHRDDGRYEWQGYGWEWLPTPARARRDGRRR